MPNPCFPTKTALALFALVAVPDPAHAEALLGGGSFGAGLTGPVVILVQLLGLLALGLWAAGLGGKAVWQVPAVALAALVVVGLLHQTGLRLPHARLVLEGGLVVLGGLVALQVQLPLVLAMLLAGVAGAAHGVGLSGWAGAVTVPLLFWLGAACGGLLTAAAGVGLTGMLAQALSPAAVRAAGAGIAVCGGLMLLGLL